MSTLQIRAMKKVSVFVNTNIVSKILQENMFNRRPTEPSKIGVSLT